MRLSPKGSFFTFTENNKQPFLKTLKKENAFLIFFDFA